MSTDEVLRKQPSGEGVLRLILNDPAQRNALSWAMLEKLQQAIDEASVETSVRVIILSAEGTVFCAGHNLKELTARRADSDRGRGYFTETMALCSRVMQSIVCCPKPVIAEVAGTATAAGCQLVASCDLAYAAESAQFSTPGVHIGLFCSTPMVALSRNVAHKHAMEMLLTGENVLAPRAAEIGLVNKAVALEELPRVTWEVALKIAMKSQATVATGKSAFYTQCEMPLSEAYLYASEVMVDNMLARDASEGIGAFLEKRPPNWQD